MNGYIIYEEAHYSTILYYAIASDENQVRELAENAGIILDGLAIELDRKNVRDQLGRPYKASIKDAQVY